MCGKRLEGVYCFVNKIDAANRDEQLEIRSLGSFPGSAFFGSKTSIRRHVEDGERLDLTNIPTPAQEKYTLKEQATVAFVEGKKGDPDEYVMLDNGTVIELSEFQGAGCKLATAESIQRPAPRKTAGRARKVTALVTQTFVALFAFLRV